MRSGEAVRWRGSPATGCFAAKRRSADAPHRGLRSKLWGNAPLAPEPSAL